MNAGWKSAADWAKEIGTSRGAVYHRHKQGYFERQGAMFRPLDPRALDPSYAERRASIEGLAEELSRSRESLKGLVVEDVISQAEPRPAMGIETALLLEKIRSLEEENESLRNRIRLSEARP